MYRIPKAWQIPEWPNYRNHQFMRFGIDRSPETVVQVDFLPNRMKFWEKLMNESVESANDVFVSELPEDIIINNNANAIDYRLTVQFASLVIIFIYVWIKLLSTLAKINYSENTMIRISYKLILSRFFHASCHICYLNDISTRAIQTKNQIICQKLSVV